MLELTSLKRARPSHWVAALAAGAVLLTLAAASRGPDGATSSDTRQLQPIVVNSYAASLSAEPDITTLPDALAQAANDPRDNLIRFDPRAFGSATPVIKLAAPITLDTATAGHDRIDGTLGDSYITLDASACEDAGLIVSDGVQATLANLAIRGGGQRAVLIKGDARVVLDQVTVSAAAGPGLALFGRAQVSLHGGRVHSNGTHGIELHAQAKAQLDHLALRDNRQSGIAGFNQSLAQARDCQIQSNGDWNVVLTDAAAAELTACVLAQARFANADLADSARLNLTACRVEQGSRFGIFATGESRLSLTDTRIGGHAGRGLELQDATQLTLDASRVEDNGDYGLILFGKSSVHARKTGILRNAAHGVSLRGQADGRFEECLFLGNRFSGIGCLDASDGGHIVATQCTFLHNGMRPIYRGPMHLDPLVPTPVSIAAQRVRCLSEPNARIELFLDRAGEATHYLTTVQADDRGRFEVNNDDVPAGWVMTATANTPSGTSEFNVIAGGSAGPVLGALLARTGRYSDRGGEPDPTMLLRRWKPGTRLTFHVLNPPTVAVERYLRFLVACIDEWTQGAVKADLLLGSLTEVPTDAVVIPVRYVDAACPQLLGRGGVTYLKWDAAGHFQAPMEIVVALGKDHRDTCPRVLAHEIGHTLGLCHVRVGLLSRMQGSVPPGEQFINDFSPMFTYYDVLALQALHDPRNADTQTLGQLVERGLVPPPPAKVLARTTDDQPRPTFSPAAPQPPTNRNY